MKKLLTALALLASMSSFATEYVCIGLDKGYFIGNIGSELVEIGTVEGARVTLSDNGQDVSMTLAEESLVTVISASSGKISFHQNNGRRAVSIACIAK